jgi:hypothetical protein
VEFVPFPQPSVQRGAKPSVFIKCPETGKDISTGIQLTSGDLSKLPNIRRYTQCPHCRRLHGWMPNEAYPKQVGVH